MYQKRGKMHLKKSQVWVETVIYTLIGLSLLGLIIGIVTPKVGQMMDRIVITQSIESLNKFNEQLTSALNMGPSNTREIQFLIKKGEYTINGIDDNIQFTIKNSGLLYSQLNESITPDEITRLTVDKGNKKYDIILTLDYSKKGINITYSGADAKKILTTAPTAYRLLINNKNGKQIDIEPLSS